MHSRLANIFSPARTPLLHTEGGFAIVEAIVGLGMTAMLLVALQTLVLQTITITDKNTRQLRGLLYAREAVEVARDLEQSNWTAFPATCPSGAPGEYHPAGIGGTWNLAAGQETLETAYTRLMSVEAVYRSQAAFPNEIVSSGGICDENTKKVIVTVSWQEKGTPLSIVLATYVYRFP